MENNNTSPKRILIVDDDEFFIQFQKAFLQREHFEILEARDGQEALETMREQRPDIVLLDLHMPGMDGLEVLVRARAEGMIDLPIVMVSKEEDTTKIKELKEAGAIDFLTKPIDIDIFMGKVSTYLKETHRTGQRLPVSIKIRYQTLDELLHGESKDLSTTGIFVRSKKKIEIGSLVELFLYPADDTEAEPIRVMGEVVRKVNGPEKNSGVGMKFISLDPESVELIARLLEEERKHTKVDVLVVDDDKVIREILKDALADAGWRVGACSSAIEALKELDSLNPSLLLVDIMMPDMNGIEFCEAFRKNSIYKDVPFIFISGKVDKETVMQARDSGATLFIAKPFDVGAVISKVNQLLGAPGSDS